ncbi:MAG: DUF4097 family beta strand repeat-containing protein [Acidimicrobiales bacterium]
MTTHDESGATARTRRETFHSGSPVAARLATRSGDIVVTTSSTDEVVVTLRTPPGASGSHLDGVEVEFDAARQTLRVTTPAALGHGGSSTARPWRRSFIAPSPRDVDVEVSLPEGSDVEIDTASGDSVIRGAVKAVSVHSASGDVVVDDADSVSARTASGDLMIGRTTTSLSVQSASGDVVVKQGARTTKIESASGDVRVAATGHTTEVSTASGDVNVGAACTGKVSARSASGDVRISVAPGLNIDVDAHSVTGELTSTIDLSRDGSDDAGEVLDLRVGTVSGDVAVVRA